MLLQHETTPDATVVSPLTNGQVPPPATPFTPEEMAQAIGELAQERAFQESVRNPTAQLSEILARIGFATPAAAIVMKIQQRRNEQKDLQTSRRWRWLLPIGVLISLVGLAFAGFIGVRHLLAKPAVPKMELSQIIATDLSSDIGTKKTLAEMPEGTTCSITGDQLGKLLGAEDMIYSEGATWQLIKQGGLWRLIGFTDSELSRSALMAADRIMIQNNTESMLNTVRITVPISDIRIERSEQFTQRQQIYVRFLRADRVEF